MRRLVLLAALLAARTASANQCPALMRHVVTPEVPLGCPVVVYQDHVWNNGAVPGATLEHAGTYSELVPTATSIENETLPIYMETIDADCVEHNGYQDRLWDRITLDVGTVEVGDIVRVYSGFPDATITAAGPCPDAGVPSEFVLKCQDPIQNYWACEDDPADPADPDDPATPRGDDGGGCNAGGGVSLAAVALLAGLRRRNARATSRR